MNKISLCRGNGLSCIYRETFADVSTVLQVVLQVPLTDESGSFSFIFFCWYIFLYDKDCRKKISEDYESMLAKQ